MSASAPLCCYAGRLGVPLTGGRTDHSTKGVGFPPETITGQRKRLYCCENVPRKSYRDDVIILSDDKRELAEIKDTIENFLHDNLHLDLNKKTAIRPVLTGIDFVGFRIWATHKKLKKQTARRMIRNVKRLCEAVQNGKTSKEELLRVAASYNGILGHCNSYGLRNKIWERRVRDWTT